MRILFLTPGSGDQFYCENCLRDKAVLTALRRAGHDALSVPLYLPLMMEATRPAKRTGVFFGGLNVFLQQKLAFFRRSPRWVDRLLDAGWLLRILARRAGATEAGSDGSGPSSGPRSSPASPTSTRATTPPTSKAAPGWATPSSGSSWRPT